LNAYAKGEKKTITDKEKKALKAAVENFAKELRG